MKSFWRKLFTKGADKAVNIDNPNREAIDLSPKLKLDLCWQKSLGLDVDYITEAQLEKITAVRLFEKPGEHNSLLNSLFPNASLVPYEPYISFLDL